jgi:hypothetical protein
VTVRGPRHRVEARHIPPQVLAQGLGPWLPVREPTRWHYDRENAPPPVPGIDQKAEVPEPVAWHREIEMEVQPLGPRPLRIIPEPPVWQGGGVQQPVPGPLRAIPEPPEWHYRLDAGIPYDDGLDVMLGM